MKRTISLALVFVLCLSLCACGTESQEDVAGAYYYVSGIGEDSSTIYLNDDFTYDGHEEKGTYKAGRNKIFLHRNNNSDSTTTLVKQGDVYYVESSFEPIKDEYGQTVTFSKEGRIDHTFSWSKYDTGLGADTDLVLRKDGTFTMEMTELTETELVRSELEGTYSLENSILTLTGEDFTFYFVCTEEGITRKVYKKYTSEEIKDELLGYWKNGREGEILGCEFLEDGTVIKYTSSGTTTYTYEIMEDGSINCVGSDGSDPLTLRYFVNKKSQVWLNVKGAWERWTEEWFAFERE